VSWSPDPLGLVLIAGALNDGALAPDALVYGAVTNLVAVAVAPN
jgi:hypothetical protein